MAGNLFDKMLQYFTRVATNGGIFLTLRIKELRKEQGLTIKQLAVLANVPRSTLGEIEIHMRTPKPEYLKRIAKALGTTVDELYK